MKGTKELLTLALRASLEAGEAILKVYASADPRVELKQDLSPLTQADRDAHGIIEGILSPSGFPLLSEEGRLATFSERSGWEDLWMVDPLDGTKEFLQRNGEFTVNVALLRGGRPLLGVVFAPALKALYFGAQGLGAFKARSIPPAPGVESLLGSSEPIRARTLPREGPWQVTVSRSHPSPETQAYLKGLGRTVTTLPSGSSLKFCLLAEGKADLYPRFGPTMEWDTAAGQALLEAAGGRVLDAGTKEPLRYNKEDLHNPSFIASGTT